jgi:AraC-like DNA-binding protein
MSRRQAEEAIKKMLMSGYGHYSREEEHKQLMAVLKGHNPLPDDLANGDKKQLDKAITQFPLAAQPLRALKNSLICSVAVICRYAADLGADDEKCYALSDYYINEIEEHADMSNWNIFLEQILRHYIDLVRAGKEKRYSLPIQRAIRYIHQHLYGPCRPHEVADAVKLHANYLSTLFKAETGVSLSQFIRDRKMEEAKNLLRSGEYRISEIAEMLGYQTLSYFSKVFHQVHGCSPRHYAVGMHEEIS